MHLAPDDQGFTSFGGFTGNWKNIFPYSFVQQTPMQLGPVGRGFGITSMTNPGGSANPGHTTITSLDPVRFSEGGQLFAGFQFTVDRADSAQLGDGSEWVYFFVVPEPAALVALVLGGIGLWARRGGGLHSCRGQDPQPTDQGNKFKIPNPKQIGILNFGCNDTLRIEHGKHKASGALPPQLQAAATDDALSVAEPITAAHIDSLLVSLAGCGIRRVHWGYYGDGHGGQIVPDGIEHGDFGAAIDFDQNQWGAYAATMRDLGNPMRVAADAAHRHGLELYGYFKPYETGVSMLLPEGSPQARRWGRLPHLGGTLAWLDPFVQENPDLRIARRTDDVDPQLSDAVIRSIRLTKSDDAPTRITGDHLQIWTSDRNYRYECRDVKFDLGQHIEPSPCEVRDIFGNLVTRRGQAVRVLTLSGLSLADRYVLITTDFPSGPADFANTWDRLLTAFDASGRRIPAVYATGTAVWFPQWDDFRTGGLNFDTGRGPELLKLDVPNHAPPDPADRAASQGYQVCPRPAGFVAMARGRNAYLPGALCETEPRVQEFWLRCVGEMLEAGVDGIDLRVENHSCHTDTPEEYGFNPVVLAQVGADSEDRLRDIAAVRGRAYTDFVRQASRLVRGRGRRMRVNLNVDWFRPADSRPGSRRLAYPANIDFAWRSWVEEGLVDEATLRVFALPFEGIFGSDAVAQDMIAACGAHGVPVFVNRYVSANPNLVEEFQRVGDDGRFAGFVLYETWSYTHVTPDGRWALADSAEGPGSAADRELRRRRLTTSDMVRRVCAR